MLLDKPLRYQRQLLRLLKPNDLITELFPHLDSVLDKAVGHCKTLSLDVGDADDPVIFSDTGEHKIKGTPWLDIFAVDTDDLYAIASQQPNNVVNCCARELFVVKQLRHTLRAMRMLLRCSLIPSTSSNSEGCTECVVSGPLLECVRCFFSRGSLYPSCAEVFSPLRVAAFDGGGSFPGWLITEWVLASPLLSTASVGNGAAEIGGQPLFKTAWSMAASETSE